ncbi:MAG: hypothetical protein KJO21_05755 [Verrucomicrobiae bacterium]|nr:hypothetical protein [Verrucomicrobiae bacterium]NNJ43227.1 hypothetical protein [Akkermansiaceae bacterium]
MFKEIVTDEGAALQAGVAFFITFSVFFLIMFRAWRVRRDDDHVANLPLEGDSETSHTH